jgi:hypothetical protein
MASITIANIQLLIWIKRALSHSTKSCATETDAINFS